MPSKDRDSDLHDRPREKKHKKERDRTKEDPSSSTTLRRPRKSSRSSKSSKPTDSETHSRSHRRQRTTEGDNEDQREPSELTSPATDVIPELSRGMSTERLNMPYPSFSKAHSKEVVHSKEDVSTPTARRTDPLTPEPTDLGSSNMQRSKSADLPSSRKVSSSRRVPSTKERPPTPPETDLSSQKKRSGTPLSVRESEARVERPRSRTSWASRSTSRTESKSKVSKASKVSSQATYIKSPTVVPPSFGLPQDGGSDIDGASRSSATSVDPTRTASGPTTRPPPLETDFSPESAPDSSPKTPTQTPQFPPPAVVKDKLHIGLGEPENEMAPAGSSPEDAAASTAAGPLPPPPPPPPLNIQEAPRVDYLMQYGGLLQPVPKNLLAVLPRQNGTRPSNPPLQGAETLFAPFFNLLNQYQTVLSGNGSIAVATGHQTIARRLLDRLENVFSRDLPPTGCPCIMCELSEKPRRGLGWGEVLERTSGRIDLPQWPPFDLTSLGSKAAKDAAGVPSRPESPILIDPDIGEEFREHYLRQTKRVRAVVDKWMSNCDKDVAPLPTEVDDETLTFAVLTNLDQDDRPFFNALLAGSKELHPATRAPTPMRKPRNDFVVRTGLSIQRLYRLQQAPRDAETVLYLIKNPNVHDLLYTISEINPSEWEILTSGRFDGFLWSGAEDDHAGHSDGASRGATPASGILPSPHRPGNSPAGTRPMGSRTTTPFSRGHTPFSRGPTPFSRGPTPASFVSGVSAASSAYPNRTAVSHDEETEIAVLAEVEREILAGMEALEDAFEALHCKAEAMRTALRQRSAGLSMSLQRRRAHGIDVLPLSGESGANDRPAWHDEESVVSEGDWVGADDISELAPDDSASNISSSRHRRPRRRKERNTPAPIEEEE